MVMKSGESESQWCGWKRADLSEFQGKRGRKVRTDPRLWLISVRKCANRLAIRRRTLYPPTKIRTLLLIIREAGPEEMIKGRFHDLSH